MAKILISAGHTQIDPGDVYGELKEADLTRKIAAKVSSKLEDIGVSVTKVPLDLPLPQRIDWINANAVSSDICLEIHINSGGKRGLEGWYRGEGKNPSQELIETVLATVSDDTKYTSLGAKSEYDHELGTLTFLSRTSPITAIIETLFIDNEEDRQLLLNDGKLEELAKAIAKGINKYIHKEKSYKVTATTPVVKPPIASPFPTAPAFSAGGFGGVPPAPSSFGGAGFGNPAGGQFGADREQRKEMIKKRYAQILGREPNQNDINYFLNAGVTEDQLIKRMVESQEHVELVKAKQELAKIKEGQEKVMIELTQQRSKAREKELMVENLQQALLVKKQQIDQIIQKMQQMGISPDKYIQS